MNEQENNYPVHETATAAEADVLRIGIDIGNVLMGSDTDEPDLIFHDKRYLEATAVAGAFDAVTALVERYGAGNIFLVSKCGKTIQQRSLEWLDHHRFYEVTGVPRGHVEFCRERREKRDICERLGIGAFVDDRYSVLKHLVDLPGMQRLFLFRPYGAELEAFENAAPSQIVVADDWAAVLRSLL